jgi:hypothetical protein
MNIPSDDLYQKLKDHWLLFEESHSRYIQYGHKSAARRARKALRIIKQVTPDYLRTTKFENRIWTSYE